MSFDASGATALMLVWTAQQLACASFVDTAAVLSGGTVENSCTAKSTEGCTERAPPERASPPAAALTVRLVGCARLKASAQQTQPQPVRRSLPRPALTCLCRAEPAQPPRAVAPSAEQRSQQIVVRGLIAGETEDDTNSSAQHRLQGGVHQRRVLSQAARSEVVRLVSRYPLKMMEEDPVSVKHPGRGLHLHPMANQLPGTSPIRP
eukprot:CAMPEP_0114317892 /NCGR_PEP_ID=MMETSP0059-20121206/24201_1 /TAXON_ID=36894 /ORGANISM="Pyramimonas parkeae, Strain CCMP726" /LENGTH=205 /DNA_ID=CAMNT_0001444365 /DNA_START=1020 /DNA_END=1638 /DNA_ORIENTATION=+